jgi:sugar O-acyltransferase (sialic acid O-acetyltransferase NeuD family)
MIDLIIVGAGGFGREVLQYASDACADGVGYRIKGFLDDNSAGLAAFATSVGIVGSVAEYEIQPQDRFIIAIGTPDVRRAVADRLTARGAQFLTIIHPRAYVAPTASLGAGCVICPFAFVGPYAKLGQHVALNTYASAGHDSSIGDCSVLSPYAVVNGHVVLEEQVFLGTHATVSVGKRVGRRAQISAGAVASRNVEARALAAGNPAKSRVLFPA